MGHFGLEGQSLLHLGLRRFLRSAQHDGDIDHQTQQGGAILQRDRKRERDSAGEEPDRHLATPHLT